MDSSILETFATADGRILAPQTITELQISKSLFCPATGLAMSGSLPACTDPQTPSFTKTSFYDLIAKGGASIRRYDNYTDGDHYYSITWLSTDVLEDIYAAISSSTMIGSVSGYQLCVLDKPVYDVSVTTINPRTQVFSKNVSGTRNGNRYARSTVSQSLASRAWVYRFAWCNALAGDLSNATFDTYNNYPSKCMNFTASPFIWYPVSKTYTYTESTSCQIYDLVVAYKYFEGFKLMSATRTWTLNSCSLDASNNMSLSLSYSDSQPVELYDYSAKYTAMIETLPTAMDQRPNMLSTALPSSIIIRATHLFKNLGSRFRGYKW